MNLQSRQKLTEILIKLRGAKSRRAFARELGVTATAVIGWENCSSEPDRQNLTKIASMAGYTLDNFVAYLEGHRANKPSVVKQLLAAINDINDPYQLRDIGHAVDDRLVAIAESAGGR